MFSFEKEGKIWDYCVLVMNGSRRGYELLVLGQCVWLKCSWQAGAVEHESIVARKNVRQKDKVIQKICKYFVCSKRRSCVERHLMHIKCGSHSYIPPPLDFWVRRNLDSQVPPAGWDSVGESSQCLSSTITIACQEFTFFPIMLLVNEQWKLLLVMISSTLEDYKIQIRRQIPAKLHLWHW